jgi:hypothetical protein
MMSPCVGRPGPVPGDRSESHPLPGPPGSSFPGCDEAPSRPPAVVILNVVQRPAVGASWRRAMHQSNRPDRRSDRVYSSSAWF